MPWKGKTVMEQRIDFLIRARTRHETITDLCSEYEISRKTGYKWLNRYETAWTFEAVQDQSKRPKSNPNRTPREIEQRVIELRMQYGWAGRKLSRLLKGDGIKISRSTVDRIIARNGLIKKIDKQRPAVQRFERSHANDLWQMDFKGEYILGGRKRCYPLCILDDHSRYSIGIFPLTSPNTAQVTRSVVSCFNEYGMPDAMLMDHGTPWWQSNNGYGLTKFSVGLIKQGIKLIFGSVGHPQTQGKVERFNQTLKRSLKHRGVPQSFEGMTQALKEFRHIYNHVRPHQSLDDETPESRYSPSRKAFNPNPPEWQYPEGADVRRLNSAGCIEYGKRRYFVCEALADEPVWCRPVDNLVLIRYRHMYVREINLSAGRTTAVVRPAETRKV